MYVLVNLTKIFSITVNDYIRIDIEALKIALGC